jgi:hypothetical protein
MHGGHAFGAPPVPVDPEVVPVVPLVLPVDEGDPDVEVEPGPVAAPPSPLPVVVVCPPLVVPVLSKLPLPFVAHAANPPNETLTRTIDRRCFMTSEPFDATEG